MKPHYGILLLLLLLFSACHSPQREARQMVRRAERLFGTDPDSTVSLIDSVLRMHVLFSERERMDMAMLQAEALFGRRDVSRNVSEPGFDTLGDVSRDVSETQMDTSGDVSGNVSTLSPLMDDEFFDDKPFLSTSPELEHAAGYYARKKRYDKAARAALYSGFVQQHYGEKQMAMQSFLDAEGFGKAASDSLTVATAEYWMGKMMLNDSWYKEALSYATVSAQMSGKHYYEKALAQNLMSVCQMMFQQYDIAEESIKSALIYADQAKSPKAKRKILNNYAVLNRINGDYETAIKHLREAADCPNPSENDCFMYCLNMGKVFSSAGEMDSVSFYYRQVEESLPNANVRNDTKVSAYSALYRYAKIRGDLSKALQYHENYSNIVSTIHAEQEERILFGIQRKYNYELIQSAMNQKLIQKHRVLVFVSLLALVGLGALAISQIRLAKTRKLEAEAKTNLFHFMRQNEELVQRHKEYTEFHADLMQKQSEKEKKYRELLQENNEYKNAYQDYAERFSNAQNKEMNTILKLAVYLKDKGEAAYLVELKRAVFNGQTPWEAVYKVFDSLYPDVRENLLLQHPELTEMECKDFVLSFFGVSRQEEAVMLNTTIHTVDKVRNTVRKKIAVTPKK